MIFVGQDKEDDTTELTCVHCNGRVISEEEGKKMQEQIDYEESLMCDCGNPSDQADYVPDTPQMKHHWNCRDCGKIYQIG